MELARRKKEWLEARLTELRDGGRSDAAIARKMGLTPSWFNEAIHKPKISDAIIDKLCSTFGLRFTLDDASSEDRTEVVQGITIPPGYILVKEAEYRDLVESVKLQTRALNAVLDHIEK